MDTYKLLPFTFFFIRVFVSFKITKTKKRQQKAEKLQAKETEHVVRQKAVAYALRVTDILNTVGDDDKENFRNGHEGATVRMLKFVVVVVVVFYSVVYFIFRN